MEIIVFIIFLIYESLHARVSFNIPTGITFNITLILHVLLEHKCKIPIANKDYTK